MANYSDGALDQLWIHGLLNIFKNGILELRAGSPPANANLAPTGTLLNRIQLPPLPFKMQDSNTIVISQPWSSQGAFSYISSGAPTWARLKVANDSNLDDLVKAYPRIDCTVGTSAASEMVISPGEISPNVLITVQSFTIVRIP